MRTSEEFHDAVKAACLNLIVTAFDKGLDTDDWDTCIEPFYKLMRQAIVESISGTSYNHAVTLDIHETVGEEIKIAAEPMLQVTAHMFLDDDDGPDFIEGRSILLSDWIIEDCPICTASTLHTIEAIERACFIARQKVEAIGWKGHNTL